MPAKRRSFYDPLESFIYWDASFTIGVFDDREPYHAGCFAFAQRLQAEQILCLCSHFTHNELAFHTIRIALAAEGRRTGQYWRDVHRMNPNIMLSAIPRVEANRAELERFTLILPIPEAVNDRAFELMRRYALLPTDAYHIFPHT
jgi:predicted nucleic acid-binding protein